MNNTFNIKRFYFTFRKDLFENGKRYILLFLTMLGIMAIITMFTTSFYHMDVVSHSEFNKNLLTFFSLFFIAAGIWFASTFTNSMNSKLKRISYLVAPASNLEKFLTRWIITTIGFVIAFFTALWIADILRMAIFAVIFPKFEISFLDLTKLLYPDQGKYSAYINHVMPKSLFIFFLSLYFLFQSLFVLGSTFWEKASFIKTFTALSVIITAYILICRQTILLFYEDLDGFSNVLLSFEIHRTFTEEQAFSYMIIGISAFTVIFWILAFFRIKESEITKRL